MPIILNDTPASTVPTPGSTKNTLFFDGNLLKSKDDLGNVTTYNSAADDGRIEINFNYGDASPKNIYAILANKVIINVEIIIMTPFTDANATLSIGDSGNAQRLMATGDNKPNVAGTYGVAPAYAYGGTTQITLTITPGTSSAGAGIVVLSFQT